MGIQYYIVLHCVYNDYITQETDYLCFAKKEYFYILFDILLFILLDKSKGASGYVTILAK